MGAREAGQQPRQQGSNRGEGPKGRGGHELSLGSWNLAPLPREALPP